MSNVDFGAEDDFLDPSRVELIVKFSYIEVGSTSNR